MRRKPSVRHDDIFRALADPVRRSILTQLHMAPQCVHSLAQKYEISRPAVSRHLKVLRHCNVVEMRPQGAENIYYLSPVPLLEVQDWLHQFWSAKLGQLKTLSEGAQE